MSSVPTDTYTISRTGKATIKKDPNALLDYTFDWTDWLTSTNELDRLLSTEFDISPVDAGSPVVESQSVVNDTLAVAWVSGGMPGITYGLHCRIFTVNGRIDDRTTYLKIKER
jgi:hypothetical protein